MTIDPLDPDPALGDRDYAEVNAAKTVMLNALAEHCRNSPTLFSQKDRRGIFIAAILSAPSTLCMWDHRHYELVTVIVLSRNLPSTEKGRAEVDELAALYASL